MRLFIILMVALGILVATPRYNEVKDLLNTDPVAHELMSEYPRFSKLHFMVKYYTIEYIKMSPSQIETLHWSFNTGKLYDLEYSLTAIAWKESNAGQIPINLYDGNWGSCGIFHNNLRTVIKNENPSKYYRNKICAELIKNPEYSLVEAIKVLRHFQNVYKNNWTKIWAGYNGGYSQSKSAKFYARDIYYRTQALKFLVNNKLF